MAKKKKKSIQPGSSYFKVYNHVLETATWRAFVERAREGLRRSIDTGVRYECNERWDGRNNVYTSYATFYAKLDADDRAGPVEITTQDPHQFEMPMGTAFPDDVFPRLLRSTFGVVEPGRRKPAVPTYNGNLDTALTEWTDFARGALRKELEADIADCARRMRAQWAETQGIREGKERALHLVAIGQIKHALLKWVGKVPQDVLREALDEVVVHEILES